MSVTLDKVMCAHWNALESIFSVPDLVTSKTETLFVLESPHVDEIEVKRPAVGLSGKAMTRVLFKGLLKEPMGDFLASEIEATSGEYKLGIANVASIPLQNQAYGMNVRRFNAGFLVLMDWYRNEFANKEFSDERLFEIERIVVDRFFNRIAKYRSVKTIIPCGRFAQYYCSLLAKALPHLKIVYGVPHPSQGLWDRDAERIREIILPYFRS